MKKSIAILFAAGIFMLSCPGKSTVTETQAEDVNDVPTITLLAENSSETKSFIPPVLSVTPYPLPTSEVTAVPEMIAPAAEALPHSSQPEPDYDISVPASARLLLMSTNGSPLKQLFISRQSWKR